MPVVNHMGRALALLIASAFIAACLDSPPGADPSGECIPGSKYAPFLSNFSTDEISWGFIDSTTDSTSTIAVEDGALTIRPSGISGDYAWVTTGAPSDLDNRYVAAEVTAMTNANVSSCEVWFGVLGGPANDFIGFGYEDGTLSSTEGAPVSFSPAEHRWWQLRNDGSRIVMETSPDGLVWTFQSRVTVPEWISEATFEVGAGTFNQESGDIGAFAIDNLNLPPSRCTN